jgi:hypothetical protein
MEQQYLLELQQTVKQIVISDYGKKNDLINYIEEKLKELSTPKNIIDIIIGELNDEIIYKKYLQNLPQLTDDERLLLETNLQTLLQKINSNININYRSSYFIVQE